MVHGQRAGAAVLAVLAAGAAGGLARSQYERDHFAVEETVIASPKIQQNRRLVFLSDLHDKEFGENNKRLFSCLSRLRPDAVLVGGDTMIAKENRASLDVTKRFLDGLAQLQVPVYYANGNHELRLCQEWEIYGGLYRELRRLLRERGMIYLSDRSAYLGDDIQISGLNLEASYYRAVKPKKMKAEYVRDRLGKPEGSRFQILMAHSPLFFRAYAAWGADLSLAGHFHGGTIRIPLLGGVMTPQYQFFLPCCAGTFEKDGHWMVVSRGLGTHSINLRLGNLPQVAVLSLRKKDGK